tara:strand:+ start:532 stop:1407 length:876 start_codon:yes stop_codon:yes gene_type:complete
VAAEQTSEYRKPLRRRVYDVLKVPARAVRDRYLYHRAKGFFDQAVEQSEYSWTDLGRFKEYFEYAFSRRKPHFPNSLQRPRRYFPGLRAQPVWDPNEFEFVPELLRSREVIRSEFNGYRQNTELMVHHQRLNAVGKWNILYLHAAGNPNVGIREFFPESIKATGSVPGMGVVGQAYFSLLAPGTHIPAHCGPTNTKLRLQLRLDVPEGCEMRIGDHLHKWDEGHEILVFDDSFEHEVWIRGQGERSVLIFDFWHPDLTSAELWALETIECWTPDRRRYRRISKKLLKPTTT